MSLSEIMSTFLDNKNKAFWFVLRDLKRANAKLQAYRLLEEMEMQVFTPKKWQIRTVKGKQVRREIPCIPDLLFVHDTREKLDPLIEDIPTLQYRWVRNKYREPMVVPDVDMERFIHAVRSSESPKYYLPEEITPEMLNRRIRIVGGLLDGYEGTLITTRGSKVKRLMVELPGVVALGVEVNPEYIQFI